MGTNRGFPQAVERRPNTGQHEQPGFHKFSHPKFIPPVPERFFRNSSPLFSEKFMLPHPRPVAAGAPFRLRSLQGEAISRALSRRSIRCEPDHFPSMTRRDQIGLTSEATVWRPSRMEGRQTKPELRQSGLNDDQRDRSAGEYTLSKPNRDWRCATEVMRCGNKQARSPGEHVKRNKPDVRWRE